MKPNCASRRILIPFLLLFATGELSTVAQQPVQKNAYFKTHFQNESQFIVETIVSDLAEQVYYAKHRRLPDAQQFSVVSVLKDYGNDFPDESTPRYEITISFETNRPGLRAALQVNGPIWSPKIYAGLATMLATNAGLNVGGPREQNDDLALLSALADSTAITIEIENQKLSKALEREFTNPFFHEEAAVLLGAFALRDHAGDFSDIRLPLCRMTAHLCMAQLVSGQRAPSMTGRMADAMLFTLMNNEVSGLEKLDQLDSRDPVIMKWVRTLRAYNTKDYRQITNSAATSPIENIARFNAFARFVDVSAGWNRLTENEKKIPDYVRIAETRDFSVETGHELLDVSLPLEVKECMAIYEKCHAQQLAPAGMIRELNVAPERCFTTATDGSIRVDVIGWGQWASFFQRHVCLAMVQDFDFMERKWGVHDEAARYAAAFDKTFGGLRLYPLVRRFNCTDAASYLNAVKDGEKVCSATPHLVSFRCWHHLIVPVAGAQAPSPGALEDWIVFGAPPGTAFEAGERQFLFHYKARGPKAHELAPYDRAISQSIYQLDYGEKPTYEQAEALYRPVLPYAAYAMLRVANTVKNQPDRYEKLMAKASQLDPFLYLTLGKYCVEHQLDDKAEAYYLKGESLGADSVAISSVASWRVKYYLNKNLKDKARRVADEAGEVYSYAGLQAKAEFLEATGLYSEAFEWYSKIEERYDDSSCILDFCSRYKARTGDTRFENEYKKRIEKVFPNGFESVSLKDFGSAPKDGVLLKEDSGLLRKAGLNAGDVIVALNGIRVHNVAQYLYKRETSPEAEMILIVWQGNAYKEIRTSPPNHRFGVELGDYAK